ncbi:DUF4893 domain-containing protein [Sphingomonas sp. RB56-2]|uniref:DUF4893 domain-containing protein n=1 Tax=Sphingomonas brevis TaxID=2908206 RepID=A0ABT0S9T2_9SPHN|nr:DUF4893 domain-containing protein [Sphingomonas brevis]MCL6741137.1 DUF4893 domain-containing protein [Sphingomonas brevis]
MLLVALAASGCTPPAKEPPRPIVVAAPPTRADVWQAKASAADINRIRRVATGWSTGLAEARSAGFGNEMKTEGKLLDPDASLPRPAPTPGIYNCRMIKLGREKPKAPAYEKFKPFFCHVGVDHNTFTIIKLTGSQRPAGRMWEDDAPTRLVFLGSLGLGSEDEVLNYGDDPKRDMAGVFERIGPFRWRLVIPYPQSGAQLLVFELTPVPDQPKE